MARHCSQLSLVLEGFLGTLDIHFGESQLVKLYQELHWRVPLVFSSRPLSQAFTVCTDGGKNGATVVVFSAEGTKTKITKILPCGGSAQYKEMMAVYTALQVVPEPCNLYLDSSYVMNLLPTLKRLPASTTAKGVINYQYFKFSKIR